MENFAELEVEISDSDDGGNERNLNDVPLSLLEYALNALRVIAAY